MALGNGLFGMVRSGKETQARPVSVLPLADRHVGVVAMQAIGGQDIPGDQIVERPQGNGAGTDLVGQR